MVTANDASTDIETKVKAFCKDISASATKLLKDAAGKDGKDKGGKAAAPAKGAAPAKAAPGKDKKDTPKEVEFTLSKAAMTGVRTPQEQAKEVADRKSWVCWGAHLADKARDIIMKVDGKASFDAKKTFGDSYTDFKKAWGDAMKSNGLKNYKAGDGWAEGDSFHLELPDARMPKTDERVHACLVEYVRLTYEAGKPPNEKFEKTSRPPNY